MKTACQKEPGPHSCRFANVLKASLCILSCGLVSMFAACDGSTSPKFRQYYRQGEKLYLKHCSNCHQSDGSGLGRVYPPLDSSDYMHHNFEETVCLIRHGISGEIIVNGKQFNQSMPGIPTLSDLEVAEIATYIYNSWSHERGLLEVREVSPVLNNCEGAD